MSNKHLMIQKTKIMVPKTNLNGPRDQFFPQIIPNDASHYVQTNPAMINKSDNYDQENSEMRFKKYIRSSVSSESKAATGGTKVFEDHNDDHDNYDHTQFVISIPKITFLFNAPI